MTRSMDAGYGVICFADCFSSFLC